MKRIQALCICLLLLSFSTSVPGHQVPSCDIVETENITSETDVCTSVVSMPEKVQTPSVSMETRPRNLCMTSYEDTLPETEETDWRESFIEMVKKLDGMGSYHFGSKASVSDKEAVSSYINGTMEAEDLTLQLDCS